MSSSQPLVREAKVRCENCKQINLLKDFLSEKDHTTPFGSVSEGLLVCPDCGHEKHVYYLTPEVRDRRQQIVRSMLHLSEKQTPESFREIKNLREEYHSIYDACQEFYGTVMGKTTVKDGTGE